MYIGANYTIKVGGFAPERHVPLPPGMRRPSMVRSVDKIHRNHASPDALLDALYLNSIIFSALSSVNMLVICVCMYMQCIYMYALHIWYMYTYVL